MHQGHSARAIPVSGERPFQDLASVSGINGYIVWHNPPPPPVETVWREFLRKNDLPSAYVAPGFFDEPHWTGKKPFAITAIDDGAIAGVVTGLHIGNHVQCGLPSRPQICMASIPDGNTIGQALWKGLLFEADDAELIDVYSWAWDPLTCFQARGFKVRQSESNVLLDLSVGAERLFKQFHETRRRNIRAALRNGIEVAEAVTDDDAKAYYSVYSAWRHTERKLIRNEVAFSAYKKIQHLTGTHRVFLAWHKERVIAATIVRFYSGGLIEYSSNCSLDEFIHLRPNDLLLWRTIEWACEQGFKKYSLGAAHSFLRKFGGVIVPIYRYRLDRSFLHRHNLNDSFHDSCRYLMRHLPAPVSNGIKRAQVRKMSASTSRSSTS